jgi:NodT family efflux transporter outer membrane factor (OMF) lipoprotein
MPPKPTDIASWHDRSAQATVKDSAINPQSNPNPTWWNGFHDPILTALMKKAIAGNLDLQQAVLRIVESRQMEASARAAALPMLNGTASYNREQLGAKGILESNGAYSQLNTLANQNSSLNQFSPGLGNKASATLGSLFDQISQPINLYQYGLDASWELDVFGKVRRSVEQAHATTQAESEAASDALVMLEGEIAQTYIQLRGAQSLTASQHVNIADAQISLDLTERRQRQGLATDLDVEQARTQLTGYEAQLPAYEKQSEQSLNSLSVLTGQPPGALDTLLVTPAPLPPTPHMIGVGVPSTLARRRPDIREAEAQLHAATANVGVAVAGFYPDISLTGNIGLRASDASYLTNWASAFYAFGPSVSLPIFQGGKLTATLHMARAEEAEAALKYRGTVLNALREVENALVAYRTDRAAREKQAETVRSGETTLTLARSRYTNGLSDFLSVLDAERTLVASRQQLIQSDMTLADDVVALYKALGGGWQESVGDIPVPPVSATPPMVPRAVDGVAAK